MLGDPDWCQPSKRGSDWVHPRKTRTRRACRARLLSLHPHRQMLSGNACTTQASPLIGAPQFLQTGNFASSTEDRLYLPKTHLLLTHSSTPTPQTTQKRFAKQLSTLFFFASQILCEQVLILFRLQVFSELAPVR